MNDWKRSLKVTIEVFVDAPDDRWLSPLIDEALREAVMGGTDNLPYGDVVTMNNGVSIRMTPENEYRENGVPVLMKYFR